MHLLRRISSALLATIFCHLSLHSQTIHSQHFSINNGLPSNTIYCFLKDSRGIFWIGTENGLVKYDGYSFETFTTENGLAGNAIWDIKEDAKQQLWIACNGDGLSCFTGNKFINYSKRNGLVDNRIRTLYCNKKGELFIGTERGLSIWNGHSFSNYLTTGFDRYDKFQVMQFWEENNRTYFLSRTHGYYEMIAGANGYRLDSLGRNLSQTLFIPNRTGNLYSNGSGLFKDPTGDKFPLNFSRHEKLMDNIVWDYEKVNNTIYLAAYSVFFKGGGLYTYSKGILTNISEKYGIQSDQIWSIYRDRKENKLWIATVDNGFYILDLKPKIEFHAIGPVSDIRRKGKSMLMICNDALILPNRKIYKTDFLDYARKVKCSQSEDPFNISVKILLDFLPKGFELNRVKAVGKDVYVSSNKGLFILNEKGQFKSFIRCELDEFECLNDGSILCQWSYGDFYVIKKVNGKWKYTAFDNKIKDSPFDIVEFEKAQNTCYLASTSRGLFRVSSDGQTLEIMRHMSGKRIVSMALSSNVLYVATANRLIQLFDVGKKFRYLRSYSGDDFIGETILKIEATERVLAVLTNRGLNIIGKEKSIFMDAEQGLNLSEFTCAFMDKGLLYIGTKSGYYRVDLNRVLFSKDSPLTINLREILVGKNKMKQRKLWRFMQDFTIELPYDQNTVKLVLNMHEYYHPKKMRYSYRINSSAWEPIRDKQISLQELSSGKYIIWIKQEDLLTGKKEIIRFKHLIIARPFWEEIWFIGLILFLSSIVLFIWVRRKIRRIQREEVQKFQLSQRIAETKMEALQSQMNPHFIFNALTAIQNYMLKTDVENALYYMGEFSRLIRQTLEFSSKPYIPFNEELDYLMRYVALENMRYGNRVTMEVDFDGLDPSTFLIPPLLIQPLIENAFEHGFLETTKRYHLRLKVSILNGKLLIQVIDDGEGLHLSIRPDYASRALSIIEERIQLLDPMGTNKLHIYRENENTITQLLLSFQTINA